MYVVKLITGDFCYVLQSYFHKHTCKLRQL